MSASLSTVPGWAHHYVALLRTKSKSANLAVAVAANVNVAVAGIKVTDAILSAYNTTDSVQLPAEELPRITSAGNIQFPVSKNGKTIIVTYYVA